MVQCTYLQVFEIDNSDVKFKRNPLIISVAFLDIPEVATQLQNNYKYWRELDEQQTAEIAGSDT